MLWRVEDPDPRGDGDKIHYNNRGLSFCIELNNMKYAFDIFARFCILYYYQEFLLDYIEYLIETGIDRQLAKEDMKRQKEQHQKDYEKWLFFSSGKPVLDRPLADIIAENTEDDDA